MARSAVCRHRGRRPRPRALPARTTDRPRPAGGPRPAVLGPDGLRQHHSPRPGRALPRQPRHRRAPACLHALERDGDGGEGEPAASARRRRSWRAHLVVRVAGHDARRRLQPLLARRARRPRRRPHLLPGPFLTRHLCPGLHGRPHHRRATAQLPPGGERQRHQQLPAPQADARVLAVPDRQHGPGAADGHLPGALPQVPARTRHRRHGQPQGLGFLRRRRDGRARVAGRHRHGRAREARQPDLRRQLQPAAARRARARQRQDHPGARRRIPWLGLERHQALVGRLLGPALGARQGGAAAQGDAGDGRWRLPGLQGQRRRLRAAALLRQAPQARRDGRQDERRRHLALESRRARPAEGLRGLPPRREHEGPADRAAGEDREGLRHGQER
jgi:hypothetical protein